MIEKNTGGFTHPSVYQKPYRYCHVCGTATPWDYGECYRCAMYRRERTRTYIIIMVCIGMFGFVIWRLWTGV